jgi:hypothetical protein
MLATGDSSSTWIARFLCGGVKENRYREEVIARDRTGKNQNRGVAEKIKKDLTAEDGTVCRRIFWRSK